jgi:hypothetical protein
MSGLFFIVCSTSLLFFVVFLFECWRPPRKASKRTATTLDRPRLWIAPADVNFQATLKKRWRNLRLCTIAVKPGCWLQQLRSNHNKQ